MLRTLARILCIHVALGFVCDSHAAERPNIVFILSDDLGQGDLGCYGNTNIQTPNLDQMAREGTRFTQAYCGTLICPPSRMSCGGRTARFRRPYPADVRPDGDRVSDRRRARHHVHVREFADQSFVRKPRCEVRASSINARQGQEADIQKIDEFTVAEFARFVARLRDIREGNGNMLDNCLVTLGSAMGDGREHDHDQLPCVVAGHARSAIQGGRHLKLATETPMANLFDTTAQLAGLKLNKFGNSTGPLTGLLKS